MRSDCLGRRLSRGTQCRRLSRARKIRRQLAARASLRAGDERGHPRAETEGMGARGERAARERWGGGL